MKRSHGNTPLIPTALIKQGRDLPRPTAATADPQKGNKGWFRIENKDEGDSTGVKVYIYDEIGYWGVTASAFVEALASVDADAFDLHINSPGGDVWDGTAIYNAIKTHKATVTAYVDGLAASAASFIAQAADVLIMGEGSTMMIHDASGFAYGNAGVMAKQGEILDKVSDNIADIYAARAGGTSAEWRAMMLAESWYKADEAVEAGLADSVQGRSDDEEKDDTTNSWNLSFFNYEGRDKAPSPDITRQMARNIVTNKERTVGVPQPKAEAVEAEPTEVEKTEETVEETQVEQTPVTEVEKTEAPEARAAGTFVVNGLAVTDSKKVQDHINGLELFAKTVKEEARNSFVDELVRDGKMLAPQAEDTKKFLASLTPEQFDLWKAPYAKAPKLPLFGNHVGASGSSAPENGDSDAERIAVLEEVVDGLRNSNFTQEKLEASGPYKELQALKAKKQ